MVTGSLMWSEYSLKTEGELSVFRDVQAENVCPRGRDPPLQGLSAHKTCWMTEHGFWLLPTFPLILAQVGLQGSCAVLIML